MNGYRESDSPVISEKPSNKPGDNKPVAEKVEKRGLAGRNPSKQNRSQAQSWISLPNELDRIRYAAQRNREKWGQVYVWPLLLISQDSRGYRNLRIKIKNHKKY